MVTLVRELCGFQRSTAPKLITRSIAISRTHTPVPALHQNGLTSPIVTGTAPRCGSSTAPKKRKVADETFYLLWEVTGRVELPDLAEIPDADVGKDVQENLEQLTRWRIPGTEITIDRIAEGPRAGEFLFSSDTVKQAPRLYITDTLDYPPEGSPDADRG